MCTGLQLAHRKNAGPAEAHRHLVDQVTDAGELEALVWATVIRLDGPSTRAAAADVEALLPRLCPDLGGASEWRLLLGCHLGRRSSGRPSGQA